MKTIINDINPEEQYLRIVERYKGIITKVCFYYSEDAEEFKDLRQDILAGIWSARDSFRSEASLSTWIYRISLNTCISALRKRKQRGERIPLDSITEPIQETEELKEAYQDIHTLINSLRNEDKAIILLWLDEVSYEEISEIMGLPRNTVATKLRRIKQQLATMVRAEI